MELNYFGLLRSPVSWAKIGRELACAFIKAGDTVHAFERRGFSYNKDFRLAPELEKAVVDKFLGDKTLSFEHPSNYKYITTKQKYGMLVYETTRAPKAWADRANETLDLLFLPNEFNRKIFIEAGVKPEIIRIVPHGFNEGIYRTRNSERGTRSEGNEIGARSSEAGVAGKSSIPATELRDLSFHSIPTSELRVPSLHSLPLPSSELRAKNRFQFLCVAMPQRRKGIDVLLSAFEKAFDGKDDTELLIKFPYAPGKSKYDVSPEEMGIGNRELGIAGKQGGPVIIKSQIPNVKFIIGGYSEEQMADLYRSADCFVLPSRAEGFGLVYLEALACGVPVIATGWGGHMDFLNEKNSLLLEYKTAPAAGIQYDNEASGGLMAEPSVDDLVCKLRHMYANYDKENAKPGNLDLSRFYWGNIAARMREEMEGRV